MPVKTFGEALDMFSEAEWFTRSYGVLLEALPPERVMELREMAPQEGFDATTSILFQCMVFLAEEAEADPAQWEFDIESLDYIEKWRREAGKYPISEDEIAEAAPQVEGIVQGENWPLLLISLANVVSAFPYLREQPPLFEQDPPTN